MKKRYQIIRIIILLSFATFIHAQNIKGLLELNTTINGAWTDDSEVREDLLSYVDYYTFTLEKETLVHMILRSELDWEGPMDAASGQIYGHNGKTYVDGRNITEMLPSGTYTLMIYVDADMEYKAYTTCSYSISLIETKYTEVKDAPLNEYISGEWNDIIGHSNYYYGGYQYPTDWGHRGFYSNKYKFIVTQPMYIDYELYADKYWVNIFLDITGTNDLSTHRFDWNGNKRFFFPGEHSLTLDSLLVKNYDLILHEGRKFVSEPIDINQTVSLKKTNEYRVANNQYFNLYSLSLGKKTYLDVNLNKGSIIFSNDMNGSIQKLDIEKASYNTIVLDEGNYTLLVKTDADNSLFSLNNGTHPIGKDIILDNVDTIIGEWESRSSNSTNTPDYHYVKAYNLIVEKDIRMGLQINAFSDEWMVILDGKKYTLPDGGGSRRNLKIDIELQEGNHTLEMILLDSDTSGDYEITFHKLQNPTVVSDIKVGDEVSGELTDEDLVSYSEFYKYYNLYTFTLTKTTTVGFDYSRHDNYLWILDTNHNVIAHFIENINITLSAGTYIIKNGRHEKGNYRFHLYEYATKKPSSVVKLYHTLSNSPDIHISWKSKEGEVIQGYKIYLNNKLVATLGANENSYNFSTKPNTTYTYSIVAFNNKGDANAKTSTFKTKKFNFGFFIPILNYSILN